MLLVTIYILTGLGVTVGFHRMLTLPADVAPDKATAKMENGVLEIHLPKQEPTPARTAVKVKVQ